MACCKRPGILVISIILSAFSFVLSEVAAAAEEVTPVDSSPTVLDTQNQPANEQKSPLETSPQTNSNQLPPSVVQAVPPAEQGASVDEQSVSTNAQDLQAQSVPQALPAPAPSTIPHASIQPSPAESEQQSQQGSAQTEADRQLAISSILSSSAERYPYIVNPTDNLTFLPQSFKPSTHETYGGFDIRFAQQNPVLNQLTIAHFPQSDQFYWVLNGNRVVAETSGWQGGISYQGQSAVTRTQQQITLQQVFGGTQAVWNIPRSTNVNNLATSQNTSLVTVSGAIRNPAGVPAGRVIIDSGLDLDTSSATGVTAPPPNLGNASSYSATGGTNLFQSLSSDEAPLILQGFPTVDLSPLLEEGDVRLRVGETIPNAALARTGISWGDIFTGEPARFTAPTTSTPGLKIGQLQHFGNRDLLSILVNPNLEGTQRDMDYLNSLFWTSYGRREPEFQMLSQDQTTEDWYRIYISHAHNRVAIDYDPVEARATYTNVFANPGISAFLSLDDGIDGTQSLHATVGLALGGLFEAIDLNHLNRSLAEAKQAFNAGEKFGSLSTQATSEQRRQINQRLNQTLAYANFTSGLEQVSGGLTFPSSITPDASNLLRLQTGLHRRSVQFLQQQRNLTLGNTFISSLRLSNRSFGPLTFTGMPAQSGNTSSPRTNEAFAVETILTSPDGPQLVQRYDSTEARVNPLMVRGADLAFDRMELTRIDQLEMEYDSFNGYLSLPAIEMTLSGSLKGLNYSLSSGLWFNFNSNQAPGVEDNNLGIQEPPIGIYVNGILNFSTTDVIRDGQGNATSLNSYGPLFRLNWDSTDNLFAALNYTYSHQERNWGYSLTPGVAFALSPTSIQWFGFLNGELRIGTGLQISGGIEFGEGTFFNVQAIHPINPNLSVGAYMQNFSSDSDGLEQRNLNLNYGALLRYNLNGGSTPIELRIGAGERGLDIRLGGKFQF